MLKVFNTLGKEKQVFKPINPGKVLMYHCGPTVYWNQHIGNMRGMVAGDLIRRSLIYLGYQVNYVSNYTDFGHLTSDADTGEDKMEKAAKREKLDPEVIADKYIAQYEKDIKALNILLPNKRARATNYINYMIKFIQDLLDKGYAYLTPKAIYFDIEKFPKYTELSNQKLEKNIKGAGTGSVEDPAKKNPADFALWFFKTGAHKNALQFWPSPFKSAEVENGFGIPGWHIECSTMANIELGKTIDIHMGGVEHIPVHHTNEIAQSESINNVKFTNYWLHNEHLTIDNIKISKSLGNFYLVDDLAKKGYDPMHLRYLFLQSHYRSKQNFTFEALDGARTAYEKIAVNMKFLKLSTGLKKGKVLNKYKNKFIKAIEDDFNIPLALAVLWEVLGSKEEPQDKLETILNFDNVLGLKLKNSLNIKENNPKLSPEIKKLIKQRQEAREQKNWKKADSIRDVLIEKYKYKIVDK